jgi:AcrR family transcriptional regulator
MVRYAQERERRPRNSITRDEIIRVALAICETDGVDALTIRAVASAMGAAPMSLYNHVATKDELLDAVLDAVMGRLLVATDTSKPWQDELAAFALALAEHLDAHRWAVLPLMTRPDPGDRTTAVGEVALAAALRGGLSASSAVTAFAALLSLVYGRAAFLAAAERPGAQPAGEIEGRISDAGAAMFPATASVASELVGYASPVHLERAVRAVIAGLSAGAPSAQRGVDAE